MVTPGPATSASSRVAMAATLASVSSHMAFCIGLHAAGAACQPRSEHA